NLAWGIIDAGVYLLAILNERGRKTMLLRAIQDAPDLETARRLLADELPPLLAAVVPAERLESMRQGLRRLPLSAEPPAPMRGDLMSGLWPCVMSFLLTFAIVMPFMFSGDPRLALRVSHAVAIVMLFFCGYAFGYRSGLPRWLPGLSRVIVGIDLVAVAI